MMKQLPVKLLATLVIMTAAMHISMAQNELPDVFRQGTVSEQVKYLDERTRIYENYRAIREDMYRSFSRNITDSLNQSKNKINTLIQQTSLLEQQIDSLQKSVETADAELTRATSTKNSIRVLGIEVGKVAYNSVMWTLVAVLAFLLIAGYLIFRQNRIVTVRTRKDLDELQASFEDYRTKTRLDREKTAIEHFNELKRAKGN